MKTMKKILAAAAVLVIGCASAFAFDEESFECELIDTVSREEFEAEDLDEIAQELVMELTGDSDAQIEYVDDETEFSEYTYSVIEENFEEDGIYVSYAVEELDEESGEIAGWIAISHASSEDGIAIVQFYFEGALQE